MKNVTIEEVNKNNHDSDVSISNNIVPNNIKLNLDLDLALDEEFDIYPDPEINKEIDAALGIYNDDEFQDINLEHDPEKNKILDNALINYYERDQNKSNTNLDDTLEMYAQSYNQYQDNACINKLNDYANKGNITAKYLMANIYIFSTNNIKLNKNKAIKIYQELAELKHVKSMFILANLYKEGIYIQNGINYVTILEKNKDKFIMLLQSAADLGHNDAKVQLAECYEQGIFVEANLQKAYDLYNEAKINNNALDAQKLSNIKFSHIKEMDLELSSAKEIIANNSNRENLVIGYKKLINLLFQGNRKVKSILDNILINGSVEELDALAFSYRDTFRLVPNLVDLLHLEIEAMEKSAAKGSAESNLNLFTYYNQGLSVTINEKEQCIVMKNAFKSKAYLDKCLEKKYPEAQAIIAEYWIKAENTDKAFEYLESAMSQGYLPSQHRLACLYNELQPEKCISLLLDAAEKDYAKSQYILASCYYFGKIVEKNINLAQDWFTKAALNGNNEAREFLRKQKFNTTSNAYSPILNNNDPFYSSDDISKLIDELGDTIEKFEYDFSDLAYDKNKALEMIKNNTITEKELSLLSEYAKNGDEESKVILEYQAYYFKNNLALHGLACYYLDKSKKTSKNVESDLLDFVIDELNLAVMLYINAAAKGNSDSCCFLGNVYSRSLTLHSKTIVGHDLKLAFNYYEKAVQLGNIRANYDLADLILHLLKNNIKVVDKEISGSRAEKLLMLAAESNYKDSLCKLGIIYYKGLDNIKQDLVKAKYFFTKASDNGDKFARKLLQDRIFTDKIVENNTFLDNKHIQMNCPNSVRNSNVTKVTNLFNNNDFSFVSNVLNLPLAKSSLYLPQQQGNVNNKIPLPSKSNQDSGDAGQTKTNVRKNTSTDKKSKRTKLK